MIAVSEIGVSRTRSPNLSWRPRISPNTLPPWATSMPATKTRSSWPAPPRGRSGWRPSCGRPAHPRPAAAARGAPDEGASTKLPIVAASGGSRRRAASTASSSSPATDDASDVDRRWHRSPRTRVVCAWRTIGSRAFQALDLGLGPGIAAGRPRSGRASDRWALRRSWDLVRLGRRRPRLAITEAVAVTSLPSTAT